MGEIDARYRPVLIGFARSLGLPQSDAEDAAQWTLAELSSTLSRGQYERGKGGFVPGSWASPATACR